MKEFKGFNKLRWRLLQKLFLRNRNLLRSSTLFVTYSLTFGKIFKLLVEIIQSLMQLSIKTVNNLTFAMLCVL